MPTGKGLFNRPDSIAYMEILGIMLQINKVDFSCCHRNKDIVSAKGMARTA